MKKTLDLRDDLLARAKDLAASERTSLDRIIEQALTLRLNRPTTGRGIVEDLPLSKRSGGLRNDVDATTNRSLIDAADA